MGSFPRSSPLREAESAVLSLDQALDSDVPQFNSSALLFP